MTNNSDVSVIIRCHNEDRWIGHAIQSVLDNIPGAEIIVVFHNCTDDSEDIVSMFDYMAKILAVRLTDHYTSGKAINLGVSEASRETVLVLSSHCAITEFDVGHVRENLGLHAAVFGKQVPIYRGKRIRPQYIWLHFGDEPSVNMWSEIEDRYFLHNAFAAYDRDFLKAHPFDEKWHGKEDRHWARDIIDSGGTIAYLPSLVCMHYWTPSGATWKGLA